MTGQTSSTILRRMASSKEVGPEEVPITSSRAVRMAMRRAADKAHGLAITILDMSEETVAVDGLADVVCDDHLLVGLERRDALVGLAVIDVQLRAAVIEMQTMGRLQRSKAEERPATATDAMMMTDLLAMLLKMLGETTVRTDLEGWAEGVQIGKRVASLRSAGLVLVDVDYRLIKLKLDLGADDRHGELTLLLPTGPSMSEEVPRPDAALDWKGPFQAVVNDAHATLSAQLHRFKMPLSQAEKIAVGQVIALPGCTVGSVQLLDPNGVVVSAAKLGQVAGKRAVRLETPPAIEMTEVNILPPKIEMPMETSPLLVEQDSFEN